MSSKLFGYRADGTLRFCTAKPENRGKGKCTHAEHVEITEEQLKSGYLKQHNEQALAKHMAANGITELPPTLTKAEQRARRETPVFTSEELRAQAEAVASKIRSQDFQTSTKQTKTSLL